VHCGWSMIGSTFGVELLASLPYDSICVDAQHGVGGPQNVLPFLQAMGSFPNRVPIVRAASNDSASVGHFLDAGARGIIMPMVNSREDAEFFVSSCRYPPDGKRSLGPLRAELLHNRDNKDGPCYLAAANANVVTMAMIETSQALESCEAIASTPGLDALFVGPFDLGVSLGVSEPGNVSGSSEGSRELREAVEHVKRTAHASGIRAAMFCPDGATARAMGEAGFDFVVPGPDYTHLRVGAEAQLFESKKCDPLE